MTSARARLRRKRSPVSIPLNLVLIGTSTAPACHRPKVATIHSRLLNAQIDTRSPGSMPDATSAAPNVRASSYSSANVRFLSPSTTATVSPKCSAATFVTRGIVCQRRPSSILPTLPTDTTPSFRVHFEPPQPLRSRRRTNGGTTLLRAATWTFESIPSRRVPTS